MMVYLIDYWFKNNHAYQPRHHSKNINIIIFDTNRVFLTDMMNNKTELLQKAICQF